MTKITEVEVQDIKRLEYVKLSPEGSLTIVGGDNEVGKSSLLDAIAMCLGGKKLCPEVPIRKGAKSATISVKLDGEEKIMLPPCTVTRKFWYKDDGSLRSELEIISDDGYTAPTPQGILDRLLTHAAFDPLAFSRMKPAQQAEALRELVGLDFSELDAKRAKAYSERTVVNREAASLKTKFESMPFHTDAPTEQIDTSKLVEQLKTIREANRENERVRGRLKAMEAEFVQLNSRVDEASVAVEDAKNLLAEANATLEERQTGVKQFESELGKQRAAVDALKDQEVGPIEQQIADAGKLNEAFFENSQRDSIAKELAAVKARSKGYTDAISKIDAEKAKMCKEADWPIEGLGFGETGVTLNDLPFEQASQAESLKVSTAMGFALNPLLKMLLIRDGSLLDEKHLIGIAKLAAENKGQVFMERVGEGSECHVILRDGKAVEPAAEEEAADPDERFQLEGGKE